MRQFQGWAAVILALLVWCTYGATADLGFISDDYVYLAKARDYGGDWGALFRDELYRSRATTIWITALLERCFGLAPFAYNLVSLMVHGANVLLIYGLGRWRVIGWPVALVAAAYFAIAERPHEAVMWFSALSDLLALTFSLTAMHGLLSWLAGRQTGLALMAASFALGLLSKESAVAMLAMLALVLIFDARAQRAHWWGLLPLTAFALVYAGFIFAAGDRHLHLQDGTFVLGWHALRVLLTSSLRLLWVWGVAGLALLFLWRKELLRHWRAVSFGLLWMAPALAPYSFLTYMNTVPSRHAYLANLGVALVVGVAGYAAWQRWRKQHFWAVGILAAALLLHNAGYIWLVKKPAFLARARVTEQLIDRARHSPLNPLPISTREFPFSADLARDAIRIGTGQIRTVVFTD